MPKKSAYPLRLEQDFENDVDDVSDETGLTKADILRMSMEAGFRAIDWSRMSLKHPPMKGAAAVSSDRVEEAFGSALALALNEVAGAKPAPASPIVVPTAPVRYRKGSSRKPKT